MTNALAIIRANTARPSHGNRAAIVKALQAWGEEVAPELTDADRAALATLGVVHLLPGAKSAAKPATKTVAIIAAPESARAPRVGWRPCGYPGCSPYGCDNCQD